MVANTIGEIQTKNGLHGHLVSLRAAAVYDIFGQTCLHELIKKWQCGEADPKSLTTELPEGNINLEQFMEQLTQYGKQAPVETKRNANRSTTRNLLKEGFRITQSFCQAHGQTRLMTAQSWYQFARIVVNSLSHDFHLQFRPHDLNQLPVAYEGHSIDASMNGHSLSMPLRILLAVYDEIVHFVEHELP